MRQPITTVVDEMATPSADDRAEAARHGGSRDRHDAMQATWPALTTLEVRPPPAPLPVPDRLTVAAWNIERCKDVEGAAALIRATGADVVLATEMDHGMARSGQRHTPRDLAGLLGFGYAFGVEFVELGTGDPSETAAFAGVPNAHGLHGNAILSRFPLEAPALLPLDDGGRWYVGQPKGDGQFRIGGRNAIAARIVRPTGPLTLAAAHFESEGGADDRADEAARLVAHLDALYGPGPAVIGGDLNTKAFAAAGLTGAETLAAPEPVEPAFARFAAAGFDWRTANAPGPTTRAAPDRPAWYPLRHLDWLLVRDVAAADPRIVPAITPTAHYLSDHEMIVARVGP